jgi:hypothetical protein
MIGSSILMLACGPAGRVPASSPTSATSLSARTSTSSVLTIEQTMPPPGRHCVARQEKTVTLKLSDRSPSPKVIVLVGENVKAISSYGGRAMTFLRLHEDTSSVCEVKEIRLSKGTVEATYVAERVGRTGLSSVYVAPTDAADPILMGTIVIKQ